jgi:hypothetical protein
MRKLLLSTIAAAAVLAGAVISAKAEPSSQSKAVIVIDVQFYSKLCLTPVPPKIVAIHNKYINEVTPEQLDAATATVRTAFDDGVRRWCGAVDELFKVLAGPMAPAKDTPVHVGKPHAATDKACEPENRKAEFAAAAARDAARRSGEAVAVVPYRVCP